MSIIDFRTEIYVGNVDELEERTLYSELYRTVSDLRREKTDRKRQIKDKQRSLAAERLLMRACFDFGIDYTNAAFTVSESGKPGFADIPVFFSLSHSGDRVMCVMSEHPVGCDVEHIRPVDREIPSRFFHLDEVALLDSCRSSEEKEQMFFRLWTLKESFVKCTGTGFNTPFSSFCVHPFDGRWEANSPDGGKYSLYEYDAGEEKYKYSFCIKKELP